VNPLRDVTPVVVYGIGVSGIFGASMIMSLASDAVGLMTAHIYLFYTIAARIYNWQLGVLWSLFNLFRGKKFNVLRNRLDSTDYDLDQLLLGTILFTVLFFLFPTVIVYYVLFCSVPFYSGWLMKGAVDGDGRSDLFADRFGGVESFPAVCRHVAYKGSEAITWRCTHNRL
jgi:hypothetical protein